MATDGKEEEIRVKGLSNRRKTGTSSGGTYDDLTAGGKDSLAN